MTGSSTTPALPSPGARIVVLSGAGLSAASGVPTFRDADGLWEGHAIEEVATPAAWRRDAELVRRFYDERRENVVSVLPNPAHEALTNLQHFWKGEVTLVTQNVDGLLAKAGAEHVIEMHGTLFKLRCEADEGHPHVGLAGRQDPERCCRTCGRRLRPDIVWFGEVPREMDRIERALRTTDVFVSVGTSGQVWPAAGFVEVARASGALTVEINPRPTRSAFDVVFAEPAEVALPRIVGDWLATTWS